MMISLGSKRGTGAGIGIPKNMLLRSGHNELKRVYLLPIYTFGKDKPSAEIDTSGRSL
jgi:hypothetical protein